MKRPRICHYCLRGSDCHRIRVRDGCNPHLYGSARMACSECRGAPGIKGRFKYVPQWSK